MPSWVTVQLTAWAVKYQSTEQVVAAARRVIGAKPQILYPVSPEDQEKNNPYSEYIFVEYIEGFQYLDFEGTEFFLAVMRTKDQYHLLPDSEIQKIIEAVAPKPEIQVGERVRVLRGPLRGSAAVVKGQKDNQFTLAVCHGNEAFEMEMPISWVKKEVGIASNTVAAQRVKIEPEEEKRESIAWKIIKRGPKNSRIQLPSGEKRLVPNEELAKLKSVLPVEARVPVLPVTLVKAGSKNARVRDAKGETYLLPLAQVQELLGGSNESGN